jgi:UDP-N-acetylglucosamine 2-epimerase
MLDALKWMDPIPHSERGGVVMTMHRNTNVDVAEYRRLWLDAAVLIAEQRPVLWSVHPRWKKWSTEEEKQILRRSKIQEFGPVSHQQMIAEGGLCLAYTCCGIASGDRVGRASCIGWNCGVSA